MINCKGIKLTLTLGDISFNGLVGNTNGVDI